MRESDFFFFIIIAYEFFFSRIKDYASRNIRIRREKKRPTHTRVYVVKMSRRTIKYLVGDNNFSASSHNATPIHISRPRYIVASKFTALHKFRKISLRVFDLKLHYVYIHMYKCTSPKKKS